ncbi:hypothetical protein AAZV13_12G202600 [Glycine max]|nr:TMV resistance protein N isoform C [Glycine soja]
MIHIESHDTVLILEIYGAGGIGKTTFALDIYNNIRHEFEAASFLANVREKSNKSTEGLEDLQKTLLSEMGEETEIIGASEIKRRLGHKKVLLVLDDVDSTKQLESLVGGGDWFGSRSRIIITTRDTTLLDEHVIDDVVIETYEMKALNYGDSLELFCWHAFNMSKPAENFEGVSNDAVRYAKGHPLALKVIGSNLKGGSLKDWEMELEKYKMIPNAKIQEVLEISYHSLDVLDQKIFLDIACFFKGERRGYVERILKACDFCPSIGVFTAKCLITIDEDGCLDMHDLIQDMGREIVRKESSINAGDRSRLWSHEEVLRVLIENSGSNRIEGIMLDPPSHEKVDDRIDTAFEKMENLRILIIRNTTFSTAPSYLPNTLRLLEWKGYPSKSFPPDFYPTKIVDFKLNHSSLMLEKSFKKYEGLTFINLSQCQSITRIPDVSGAINLKVLTLDKCRKLKGFDKSIGFMRNLVYVSALRCNMLKSFVPSMSLPSLEVLSFSFCSRLEHFPDVMEEMDRPLKIQLVNTAIKEFPMSIGKLTGLEYLDISGCKKLNISRKLFLLPKLETLLVDGCSHIGQSFKRFKERHSMANGCPNLRTLHLSETNLSNEELYAILKGFPRLEALKVSYNDFHSLPECIKDSKQLKSLDVSYCKNLSSIPELPPSIQKVNARYCGRLTSEASNSLWSKVNEEKERIQFVMAETDIPDWFEFDCVGGSDSPTPLMLARNKFPIIAVAFALGKAKSGYSETELSRTLGLHVFVGDGYPKRELSYTAAVHLYIGGKEICRKEYHYCCVGEEHVLLCDLMVLFSDQEWEGLDAHFTGDDEWRVIQVQCESDLPLSQWGVFVYKQKTNTDDILFTNTRHNCLLTNLVQKETPWKSEQRRRHFFNNFNLREIYGDRLTLYGESLDQCQLFSSNMVFRHILADIIKGKLVSACDYGASLMQAHDESSGDVKHTMKIYKERLDDTQATYGLMELGLEAREELSWAEGEDRLVVEFAIILEEEDGNRRYWGTLKLKAGEAGFDEMERKELQFLCLRRAFMSYTSAQKESMLVVLLKREEASTSGQGEEEGEWQEYDPILEELMSEIAEDATRLSKSYGKLKASIVPVTSDNLVSDKYSLEGIFLNAIVKLEDGKWGPTKIQLGYAVIRMLICGQCPPGLFGTKVKKMSYGILREELHDDWRWNLLGCLINLIPSFNYFILKFIVPLSLDYFVALIHVKSVHWLQNHLGLTIGFLVYTITLNLVTWFLGTRFLWRCNDRFSFLLNQLVARCRRYFTLLLSSIM